MFALDMFESVLANVPEGVSDKELLLVGHPCFRCYQIMVQGELVP